MPAGGVIRISTTEEKNGLWVVLKVTDTGSGVPEEIRARIFDPFYTTKPVGKGTGLGLSIVLGIVNAYNGDITIEDQFPRGTCFILRFPAMNRTAPGESFGPGRYDDN